jgi:hypothetical protein
MKANMDTSIRGTADFVCGCCIISAIQSARSEMLMISLTKFKYQFLLFFSVIILMSPNANAWAAKYYKWIDEDGHTVYSQTPPPRGIKAERVKGAPPPAEDPEEAMKTLRERAEAFSERRDDRLTLEKEGEEALERKKQQDKICETLRKNLDTLKNSSRVRETIEGKEPVVLGEEQRQARIKKTQERIQKECTN